jgi:hypothetical protein
MCDEDGLLSVRESFHIADGKILLRASTIYSPVFEKVSQISDGSARARNLGFASLLTPITGLAFIAGLPQKFAAETRS